MKNRQINIDGVIYKVLVPKGYILVRNPMGGVEVVKDVPPVRREKPFSRGALIRLPKPPAETPT